MFRRQKAEGIDKADMFFESNEYNNANSQVANILSVGKSDAEATENKESKEAPPEEATAEQLEADWGGDDDIDIDMGDDMLAGAEPEADGAEQVDANVDSDIFVPPNAGADQISMCLKKNPQNVGLHVAGGEFTRALELHKKQLGINDFSPLRQIFVDVHTLSKMKMQQVPHAPPVDYQMRFIDQPIVSITLATLNKMFTKGTDLTTKGEFTGAIHAFRQCLQCVPLLVISSEQAQKEL